MVRLDAINIMLAAIGEAPVTDASSQHPDVLVANNLLTQIEEQLQAPGYWFNRDYAVTLGYDTQDDSVVIPGNTLRIDPTDTTKRYVKRDGKLYDTDNNTFAIGESVEVDIIVQLSFDDCPISWQHYCAAEGAYELHNAEIGDEQKLVRLERKRNKLRGEFRADDLRNSDHNAKYSPTALHLLAGVRPHRRS